MDVRISKNGDLTANTATPLAGFPLLDTAKQKLVQMQHANGTICVGVRDDEDGQFASGWVLLKSGVLYLDHGDHGHWSFRNKPEVLDTRIDKAQGNPAHLYEYGGKFFLANDKKNGCTRVDPSAYENGQKPEPKFISVGSSHITLAAVADRVVYGTWIDGGGPNSGRVDVAPLVPSPRGDASYAIKLPHGGLHGATTAAGKVFFAPSNGICWVTADTEFQQKPEQVKVHHISLGQEGEKPRRTGAFSVHEERVFFTTGKANPELGILDAREADPKPTLVKLPERTGTMAVTPEIVAADGGKVLALIFRDSADKKKPVAEVLDVIDLDPNGDGNYSDATPIKSIPVGKSAIDGHAGHHALATEAEGGWAFFTNPGDGTVSALSLRKLEVVATFPVGCKPGAIIACGGRETSD
jgi:hypothetical protein